MAEQSTEFNAGGQRAPDAAGFAPLTFDVEAYLPHVADCDLTDDEQRAMLAALWSMMVGFVDLGLRIAPVQLPGNNDLLQADSAAVLASIPALASQFTTSAAPLAGRGQERKETCR